MESINDYMLRKVIYEIIFNNEKINYAEDSSIFDLSVIESLRNIVKYHTSNGHLIDSVKDNISEFLSQARYHFDKEREERIKLINEILILMNNQINDEHLMFYRFQLYYRTKQSRYLLKASQEEIKKEIQHVHDSICHDLYVITSHSDEFTDEEFIKESLPYLQDSNLYYESLNMMLRENPIVFKDLTFYNRMMCTLNMNNEIYKDEIEMIRYNKKLVKSINKKIKKI